MVQPAGSLVLPGSALLERGEELATLAQLTDAAVDGDGRIALLEGPAGIGKTRLLTEVRRLAEDRMQVVVARGSQLERDFPFGAVRQLLEATLADPERRAGLLTGGALGAAAVFDPVAGQGADGASFATLHFGAPGGVAYSTRELGLLRGGSEGLALLEEAVAVSASTPARLEHIRSLVAFGRGLRLARRPSDAREPLTRALEFAAAHGIGGLADQARAELAATGVRPRRDVFSGVGSLTPSELRVAELAAAGASNRDIAQQLYVTPKTVELHLSSSYRKLDIASRRELAGALAAG